MNAVSHTLILTIEDDQAVRETMTDILELNGFTVVQAGTAQEGLELARRDHPALIITDINMPGMTGFELLDKLRRDEALRTIPVIVISATVDRAATRRGMELGADDFITKPFTEHELIHSIRARLEKKELLDELDAFAHTVAHDLRSPLCTLNGRIDLLGMMYGTADETTMRHHIDEATKSARRLNDIIDELLVLAGVRRQAIVPVPLDMTAIVTESIDRLDQLLRTQSVHIVSPPLWPVAVGHPPWVIEVWVNYLSNAAKYGGSNVTITLGGETSADGRYARFWVQDQGPGLDAAAQQKMFVPFTRISTVRASGHGLGLSIVRRIMEKLGGKVGVDSTPGAGARFWFELPTGARPMTNPPFPHP